MADRAAGFAITGLDLSASMLAQARQKGTHQTSAIRKCIRLLQMDMSGFELGDSFGLALIPFRAFHHLADADRQRQALNCVNRSLIPGGQLVIDLMDPWLHYCVPGAPSPISQREAKDPATGHIIVRK